MEKKVPDNWQCKNCKFYIEPKSHCHLNPEVEVKQPENWCSHFEKPKK